MTGGSVLKAERAFESFREAVVQKELSHDGHPILWKHTVQGRRRIDHNHLTVKKDFPKSPRKIDAFIAAVLAWQARNDAVAKGLAINDNRHYVPKAIR
jgi:phage terminase large subunit-like protein